MEMAGRVAAITPESTVSAGRNHLSSTYGGSMVLMSISEGKYFAFDAIGIDVWNGLTAPIRVDALAERLAADYAEPVDTVLHDLIAFLTRLAELKLVEIA